MKVIIAGSRTVRDKNVVWDALNNTKFTITTLFSGGAQGVDLLGEEWAKSKGIPVVCYKPHYSIDNPRHAPLLRNIDMAHDSDALIAVWDGKSRGTVHMIGCMKELDKPIEVVVLDG